MYIVRMSGGVKEFFQTKKQVKEFLKKYKEDINFQVLKDVTDEFEA